MTVLLIGGLDPLGRSGVIADVQAVHSAGGEAFVVCTALTAQDDHGGHVDPVDPVFFAKQLVPCFDQGDVRVVKTGWLANDAQIEALLDALPASAQLVVDPILKTTSGLRVYCGDWASGVYMKLLARADLLTPNLLEATQLLGAPLSDVTEAASSLQRLGPQRILLKGGHGEGDMLTDVFLDADGSLAFWKHSRVPGSHRGTGCRLASFVAAQVSQGSDYENACSRAVAWLNARLAGGSKG
jgi:hydroxymethylpyrimidine/phosphomethylpyrimidine kinase